MGCGQQKQKARHRQCDHAPQRVKGKRCDSIEQNDECAKAQQGTVAPQQVEEIDFETFTIKAFLLGHFLLVLVYSIPHFCASEWGMRVFKFKVFPLNSMLLPRRMFAGLEFALKDATRGDVSEGQRGCIGKIEGDDGNF